MVKFDGDTIETLGEEDLLGCPTTECSDDSRSNCVHPWRGSNVGKENSQRES